MLGYVYVTAEELRARVHTARHVDRGSAGGMGRIVLLIVGFLLVAGGLLLTPARAPPPVPMTTEGHALDPFGDPLPIGTPVRAFIDGVEYSNASAVFDASGSYEVLTAGNWMLGEGVPETPTIKEGADLSESVLYAAADFTGFPFVFQETLPWWPGRVTVADLHLGDPATWPEPLKIQGLVVRPARGGAQYMFLCNPTGSAVDLSSYYIEVDRPGTYHGPNVTLSGTLLASGEIRVNVTASYLNATGDAVKLVFRNPGGPLAAAGGRDIVVDRVEYNATQGGTLFWEPGNTIMRDAPAPGIGEILARSPACRDTNSPADFRVLTEPGLPPNGPPTVVVISPVGGQAIEPGQPLGILWVMSDDIFPTDSLRVWANVTYSGVTTVLVNGSVGVTSWTWVAPNTEARGAVVTVDVVDPFGARGSASSGAFDIVRPQPYAGLGLFVAILVIAVIGAFLLLAFLRAARAEAPPSPPPPAAIPPPKPVPPAEEAPATPAAAEKKTCPNCGTVVNAADESCFFCGHFFPKPPTG